MNRRAFITVVGGSVLAALAAEGQQAAKVARIGYLLLPPLAEKPSAERQAFLQGLRELGYNEGHNVSIEYRSAAWNRELLPDLAAELVARKVDVILASASNSGGAGSDHDYPDCDDRRGRSRRERARRQSCPARRERNGI